MPQVARFHCRADAPCMMNVTWQAMRRCSAAQYARLNANESNHFGSQNSDQIVGVGSSDEI